MPDFHAFESGGKHFLYFPRSARFYQLTGAAASLLDTLGGRGEGAASVFAGRGKERNRRKLRAELEQLLLREQAILDPAPPQAEPERAEGPQLFTLYLAQGCNMSCDYCWNRGGSFGNVPSLMGEETAQAVAALIPSLVQPAGAKDIFVKFYGGEPLLNFPALERITLELRRQEAGLGKNFHFLLDTNGLLLEGRAARFLARHFSEVAVSVDGRQGVHDLQRRDLMGGGTWERIAGNLRYFPHPGILRLRATLTSSSDPFIDTFRQLCSLGIRRIQLEYCHLSGYRGEDRAYRRLTVPPKRQLAELREFLEHYIATIASIRDPSRVPFLSSVLEDIAVINRGRRATRPCSAGTQTLAIDCRGEIFPCIAFADGHRFSVGNVRGEAAPPVGLQNPLPAEEVEERVPCRSCWVRYHCAGGCYATHYSMTGDLMRPDPQYCLLMRGKAEIYLQALAQILRRCPWHLAPFSREAPDGGYPWRGMT